MKHKRTNIKDPIYDKIYVKSKHKKFLDSPEFQRLRSITQTSFANFVYPSANHTRFSHSLGCYYLMEKLLENNLNEISSKNKNDLMLAALLHDIGHGPMSHTWEHVFHHYDHEATTREILKRFKLDGVIEILEGKSPYSPFVSSTIDVDKLDYMVRDSYFSGVTYGLSEVNFILDHIYIKSGKLIIKSNTIPSIEDIITQRINLFKTVYFHRGVIAYEFIFKKIFKRIDFLLKEGQNLSLNKHLQTFFEKTNTVDDLLKLNDHIISAEISRLQDYPDKILQDLCLKYINRIKMKTIDLKFNKVNIDKIKKRVEKKYDLDYYYEEVVIPLKILQNPIYVEMNGKIKKVEQVSELIAFYKTRDWSLKYLIIPEDIKIN